MKIPESIAKIRDEWAYDDINFITHNTEDLVKGFNQGFTIAMERAEKLAEALTFYSQKKYEIPYDTPNVRREFGCGCCAGTNNSEGDNDYNAEVVGLTAREALEEWYKEIK